MYSCETLQTNTYEDYEMSMFNGEERKKKREPDSPRTAGEPLKWGAAWWNRNMAK
jgi:hypothetical protein